MTRLCLLLPFALMACEASGPANEADSDPSVLEVSPPYAEWTVNSSPFLRIGALDGTVEVQLFQVVYAGRLSDGRHVIVDGASKEVRWFDDAGAFQFKAGGEGEGPGEFSRIIAAVVTPQDSIVLYDGRNQRLTWFGPSGTLARTVRAELQGSVALLPLADSRVWLVEERIVTNIGGSEYNYARDSIAIMVAPDSSGRLDPFLERPGREAATWVRYVDGAPTATQQMELPFARSTLVGAVGDHVALMGNGQPEVAFFDQAGALRHAARRTDLSAQELTSSMRDQYVTSSVNRATTRGVPEYIAEASAQGLLGIVPQDQSVPLFDTMLSDAVSERLWVRDYLLPGELTQPQRWTVHDSRGRVVAQVVTPASLAVMHVGPDYITGVERDALGVEYVVSYSIQ